MARRTFTAEQKIYVIQRLACFESPAAVAKSVKAELGVDVSPQGVEAYDPTKRAGARMSPKWRSLFEVARAEFLKDTDRIPMSHKPVRLRMLQRMAEKAEAMRNLGLAAQLLKQIAEEMGDGYSNRHKHELTGKDGAPLDPITRIEVVVVDPMPES